MDDNVLLNILKHNNLNLDCSILNKGRDPLRTSTKYKPVDHLKVVETFNQHNWFITDYKQVNPQNKERSKYVKWLATYQNSDFEPLGDEAIPLVLHSGSHDGSKPLVLDFGLFNVKFLNTVVVGSKSFTPSTIKNIGEVPTELEDYLRGTVEESARILTIVKLFKSKVLESDRILSFVKESCLVRFPPSGKLEVSGFSGLVPSESVDLWSLLNFVQNGLLNSTRLFITNKETGKIRKSRPVTNIDDLTKISKEMWDLSLQYLMY